MADSNRYYEEELTYLVEAGREYARLHPERARQLNLSDPRSRDPHVERLLEGVAFLTGNIRQRLDDDFPELTHALINLLWPHYLRPVPSMALLEMRPLPGMLRGHQHIPRGLEVESKYTSQGVPCRFRTAFPMDLYPVALRSAGLETHDSGELALLLSMEMLEGADAESFALDRLRLHIAGEPAVTYGIYHVLRTMVRSVELAVPAGQPRRFGPEAIEPAGFGDGEDLLDYPEVSFPGYRLLAEYFAFPEKLLFIDLVGLGSLPITDRNQRRFSLTFRFASRPPDSFRPDSDSFHLFVTPIVNQFERDGDPIRVTRLKVAHQVIPDAAHGEAYDVVSVDEVEAVRVKDQLRRRLPSFFSFDHEADGSDGTYYHVTQRFSMAGVWTTMLSLNSPAAEELPGEEVLSPRLSCTNGRLCQELGLGDISVASRERIDFVRLANISRPTKPLYPRAGRGDEWRFIAHMALSFATLEEVSALRKVLELYDMGKEPANRRRIASIVASRARPREMLLRGAPVRGTELTLEIDETHFDDEGDLLLFCEVLCRFFGLWAGVNSFVQLVVERVPSGEVQRWPAMTGAQKLI